MQSKFNRNYMINPEIDNKVWQSILCDSVTNIQDLLTFVGLSAKDFYDKPINMDDFPLKITRPYLQRIKKKDPLDPLLLQVLPTEAELVQNPGFSHDPLSENKFNVTPGLIHKYHNRVLVTFSNTCAIHCRFCFRKYFPFAKNLLSPYYLQKILHYINSHHSINEVILSGGEPLIASNDQLLSFFLKIQKIAHIKLLRIHTKIPITLPERINEQFLSIFKQVKLPITIVIHSNHPNEIDHHVKLALLKLKNAGATLLNQGVLLRGVNDDSAILEKLFLRLFNLGVLPYYLHILDQVTGSHKFFVSKSKIINIYKELLSNLPGYLVPKLVQDLSDLPYKNNLTI